MSKKFDAVHPGTVLQKEFLDRLNVSVKDVAKAIRYSKGNLQKVLKGKKHIDPDLAILLATYFQTADNHFIHLQDNWDIAYSKHKLRRKLARIKPAARPDIAILSKRKEQEMEAPLSPSAKVNISR